MARINIQRSYGAAPNNLLNNPEISFRAKGLYAYLNSKPADWDFSIESIARQNKEGKDAIRSAIHELEAFGYLVRNKVKDARGFFEIEYILYENPMLENPTLEESDIGEPTQLYKKEPTKKEKEEKENRSSQKSLLETEKYLEWKPLVDRWISYKKNEFGKSYKTQDTLDVFVQKLKKDSGGSLEVAEEMIRNSMANNYQGVFPLKNNGTQSVFIAGGGPAAQPGPDGSIKIANGIVFKPKTNSGQ